MIDGDNGVDAYTLQMFWLNTVQQLVIGPHVYDATSAADYADTMVDRFVKKFPLVPNDEQ